MRVLRTYPDPKRPGHVTVVVAFAKDEPLDPLGAEEIDVPQLGGPVHPLKVRLVDAPQPGLQPGDVVYSVEGQRVLDVAALLRGDYDSLTVLELRQQFARPIDL